MGNLEIRQYRKSDIPKFYDAVIESIPEVSQWLPWCYDGYSLSDTKEWINKTMPQRWQDKTSCEFVIIDSSTDLVLGGCALEELDITNKKANIGYWVRTSVVGKGIATSACWFLLDYGFNVLGLDVIYVIASTKNIGSTRVGSKLPFESKTIVPNGFQIKDQLTDANVFKITKESYHDGLLIINY